MWVVGEPNIFLRLPPAASAGNAGILITEFMPSNKTGLRDKDGRTSDWIEIHNPSSQPVNLLGYFLSDDSANPNKWAFPSRILPAGGYLVIFASGKSSTGNELHTNFKIGAEGLILLKRPAGANDIQQCIYPSWPPADRSLDGDGDVLSILPTPGAPNDAGPAYVVPLLGRQPVSIVFASPPPYVTHFAFAADSATWPEMANQYATLGGGLGFDVIYTTNGTEPVRTNPEAKTLSLQELVDNRQVNYPHLSQFIEVPFGAVIRAATVETGRPPLPVYSLSLISSSYGPLMPLAPDTPLTPFGYTENSFGYRSWGYFPVPMVLRDGSNDALLQDATTTGLSIAGLTSQMTVEGRPTLRITGDPEDIFGARDGILQYPLAKGNEWERRVSVELISGGRVPASFMGPNRHIWKVSTAEGVLSVSGNSSRNPAFSRKANLNLKIGNESDGYQFSDKKLTELTGRHFELRTPTHDSWLAAQPGWVTNREGAKYVTDAWANRAMKEMGHGACDRKFVNVFLNGYYWGVYEMIPRLDNDTAKEMWPLQPGATLPPRREFDVIRSDDNHGLEASTGSMKAWNLFRTAVEAAYNDYSGFGDQEKYLAVVAQVDTANLIDYILLNLYMLNTDWPMHNFIMVRERADGALWKFVSWDAEMGFNEWWDSHGRNVWKLSSRLKPTSAAGVDMGPAWLFHELCQHGDFRELVRARAQVRLTATTPAGFSFRNAWPTYLEEAKLFAPLAAGELARWGDTVPRPGLPGYMIADWQENIRWARDVFMAGHTAPTGESWDIPVSGLTASSYATHPLSTRADELYAEILDYLDDVEQTVLATRTGSLPPSVANLDWLNSAPSAAANVSAEQGQVTGDLDRDGLPDSWEYAKIPGIGLDPLADDDGDGISNLQEYLFDTNPLSANSVPPGAAAVMVRLHTPLRPLN